MARRPGDVIQQQVDLLALFFLALFLLACLIGLILELRNRPCPPYALRGGRNSAHEEAMCRYYRDVGEG